MDPLFAVIMLTLLATLVALFLGLLAMGRERAGDDQIGNMLMWARVGLQGVAVILLLLALSLR